MRSDILQKDLKHRVSGNIRRFAGLFIFAIILSANLYAQTFPSRSSCTSKDLSLVSAELRLNNACNTCQVQGSQTKAALVIGIDNKTGSTRTSFQFWGTLRIYNSLFPGGYKDSAITYCIGPVVKNSINYFTLPDSLVYPCGSAISILNIWEAWTDASAKSSCPLVSSLIAPKCGTLDSLNVKQGLEISFSSTNATCTAGGSVTATPQYGSGSYTHKWTSSNGDSVLTGQVSKATITGLIPGTYSDSVVDNTTHCAVKRSVIIYGPGPISKPSVVVTQPTCTVPTGTITVQSPPSGYRYSIDGTTYTDSTGLFKGLATGSYKVSAKYGTCISGDTSVTVNGLPGISKPSVVVTQPTCTVPTGTITVQSPPSGYRYSIDDTTYTDSTGLFAGLATGTYKVSAKYGSCISGDTSVTVNGLPPISIPSVVVTQPTCTVATGTITVQNPLSGYHYSIDGTTYTDTTGIFTGLSAGIYKVTARYGSCTSADTPATVNAPPPGADSPTLCVIQPALCGSSTGTIKVTYPTGSGFEYSIDDTNWKSYPDTVFSGLAAGSNPKVWVKNSSGCISAYTSACSANICGQEPAAVSSNNKVMQKLGSGELESTLTVQAIPNPFGTQVRFYITSTESGRGTLEVYNVMGQKVKTIYDGYIQAGTNYYDLNMNGHSSTEYFYVLSMGNHRITGKIMQVQ